MEINSQSFYLRLNSMVTGLWSVYLKSKECPNTLVTFMLSDTKYPSITAVKFTSLV